jgi:hypothetical protein
MVIDTFQSSSSDRFSLSFPFEGERGSTFIRRAETLDFDAVVFKILMCGERVSFSLRAGLCVGGFGLLRAANVVMTQRKNDFDKSIRQTSLEEGSVDPSSVHEEHGRGTDVMIGANDLEFVFESGGDKVCVRKGFPSCGLSNLGYATYLCLFLPLGYSLYHRHRPLRQRGLLRR